jgi:hypothetical protein
MPSINNAPAVIHEHIAAILRPSVFSLIPWWGWLDVVFTLLVLVGVCAEVDWIQRRLIRDRPTELVPLPLRRERLKRLGEFVLILGLAGEVACLPIGLWETSRVNERVEELRRANDKLEAKQKPRRISPEQAETFRFLTERICKVPVRVHVGLEGDDTEIFAQQFRQMLDKAGFTKDASAGPAGVTRDLPGGNIVVITKDIGSTNISDLILFTYATNNVRNIGVPAWETTNHISRPVVTTNDTERIADALYLCLTKIGVTPRWMNNADRLKPGEWEFFIQPRND